MEQFDQYEDLNLKNRKKRRGKTLKLKWELCYSLKNIIA